MSRLKTPAAISIALTVGLLVLLSVWGRLFHPSAQDTSELTIPVSADNAESLYVRASDKFVVWDYMTGDIFGFDLNTRKEVEVSRSEPFVQQYPDVSGSLVVYESRRDDTYTLPVEIIAKELGVAGGRTYTTTTGTGAYVYPKIAGKKIAWDEGDRLMLKELDSGARTQVATVSPDTGTSIQDHMISGEYVVWSEIAYFDARSDKPRPSYLKAYNLSTKQTKDVIQFEVPGTGPRPMYSLDGRRLAIYEPLRSGSHRVINLDTGETTPVNWDFAGSLIFVAPILKGDILTWNIYDSDEQGLNIWGIDLKDADAARPVPLVIGAGDQLSAAIIGDKLVWYSRGSPGSAGITITSISEAFAKASERTKTLGK